MSDSPVYDNSLLRELGVRPVIHGGGTKTTMGGSRMRREVLDAMHSAGSTFVPVEELNRKIGAFIAKVTGAEAGMVTSGAASGVVLSIAACMTGTDPVKVKQLPDPAGMKNELVIHKIHRGKYSHMYTFTGARFVEIGDINETHAYDLEAAIGPNTAAVTYLLGPGIPLNGLTLAETVEISHRRGVPVIVDAAAMLPPKGNLRRYIEEGADLVVFSGGKLIQGPQSTGLLFGRKELVEAALANASPHHSIGRPHKVSKENMVGLYVALKLFLEQDEDSLLKEYRQRAEQVIREIGPLQGASVLIEHDEHRYHVPTAVVRFHPSWEGPSAKQVLAALWDDDPRIFVQYERGLNEITINPISLQAGEPEHVGRRLREELCREQSAPRRSGASKPVQASPSPVPPSGASEQAATVSPQPQVAVLRDLGLFEPAPGSGGAAVDTRMLEDFAERASGFSWVHMGTQDLPIRRFLSVLRKHNAILAPRSGHLGNWQDIARGRAGMIDYNKAICAERGLGYPLIHSFNQTETHALDAGDWIYLPGSIVDGNKRHELELHAWDGQAFSAVDRKQALVTPFVQARMEGKLVPLNELHRGRLASLGGFDFHYMADVIAGRESFVRELLRAMVEDARAQKDPKEALQLIFSGAVSLGGVHDRLDIELDGSGYRLGAARFSSTEALVDAAMLPILAATDSSAFFSSMGSHPAQLPMMSNLLLALLFAVLDTHLFKVPPAQRSAWHHPCNVHLHWGAIGMAGYPPRKRGYFTQRAALRTMRDLSQLLVRNVREVAPIYFVLMPASIFTLCPTDAHPRDAQLVDDLLSRTHTAAKGLRDNDQLLKAIDAVVRDWWTAAGKELSPYYINKFSSRRSVLNETALPDSSSSVEPPSFGQLTCREASFLVGSLIEVLGDQVPTAQPNAAHAAQPAKRLARPAPADASDPNERLHFGFVRSAEAFPDNIAVMLEDQSLTYREVDGAARRWARALLDTLPSRPERVAVFGNHTATSYIGTLAALFAGAAFVPLNGRLPVERTRRMLQRARVDALIADADAVPQLAEILAGLERPTCLLIPDVLHEDLPAALKQLPHALLDRSALLSHPALQGLPNTKASDVAYLLFTSGSTGEPKGVPISHRNVTHFLGLNRQRYEFRPTDRFSQTFDQTFDLSVFDIFMAWGAGAALCPLSSIDLLSPATAIKSRGITVWFSVPSVVALQRKRHVLEPGSLPTLRWSLFCGEALPAASAVAWAEAAPNSMVENLYGPTELTIACSAYRWDSATSPQECVNGIVPIGTLYEGMEALVLDQSGQPVSVGETGELCIGGAQLFSGYWDAPELTKAKTFTFKDPGGSGERLYYRTGDRVVRTGPKAFAHLGRTDHQIKVLGHRVELGDIETAAAAAPGVVQAAAVGWPIEDSTAQGIHLFVAGHVDASAVLERCRNALPPYMVPARVEVLDSLPLNSNGKIDRSVLIARLQQAPASEAKDLR